MKIQKRAKNFIILFLVLIVFVGGAFFINPTSQPFNFGNQFKPWKFGLDLTGGSHLIYEVDMTNVDTKERDSLMSGLRDVIEKRVNLFGVAEPQVITAKSGDSYRLIVDLAGVKDVSDAIRQIGETPMLDFREVVTVGTSTLAVPTALTGRYVSGAQVTFDQNTNQPQVSLKFNNEGAKIFEDLTGKNIGKPIAVYLDGKMIEMPTVQEKIIGGEAQITGKFTIEEAKKLVERFNAGALPAPIKLINQQTVSATLGADSLNKAVYAGLVGLLAVMVFMILYYRVFGIFAALALLIYTVLVLSIFKLVPITLTLAGIAGLILSIGMAVDANVLIFERIKEELKRGISKSSAVEEGFRRAWPAIRDSNITTIISAIILYLFTSSFMQGFALALLIGVLVSMFSAITVTRTLIRVFIK